MSRRQHLDRQRKNFNQRELWTRLLLTPLLLGIVLFLLYTSEDPQWAGSFWQKWLVARFDLEPSVAQTIVFWTRKTLHFVGYGTLSLLAWAVFAAWRAPLAAVCGAAFAVLVFFGAIVIPCSRTGLHCATPRSRRQANTRR